MLKIFTGILSCGILPALDQYILRASESGAFQNQNCLRCWQDPPPGRLLGHHDWELLLRILPICTDQIFFQILCTRIVESILLGEVQQMCLLYVFIFDFLDVINWILIHWVYLVAILICHILVGKPYQRLVSGATTEGTP